MTCPPCSESRTVIGVSYQYVGRAAGISSQSFMLNNFSASSVIGGQSGLKTASPGRSGIRFTSMCHG